MMVGNSSTPSAKHVLTNSLPPPLTHAHERAFECCDTLVHMVFRLHSANPAIKATAQHIARQPPGHFIHQSAMALRL